MACCRNIRGLVLAGKVTLLVLGLVLLGAGLHSHFQSAWAKKLFYPEYDFDGNEVNIKFRLYQVCIVAPLVPQWKDKSCPPISLEYYFVSIVVICFIISLLLFAGEFLADLESPPIKWIDVGYHGLAAVLVFAAGVTYILSASQINGLLKAVIDAGYISQAELKENGINFLMAEKLAAGALAIIQSICFGAVTILLAMS